MKKWDLAQAAGHSIYLQMSKFHKRAVIFVLQAKDHMVRQFT